MDSVFKALSLLSYSLWCNFLLIVFLFTLELWSDIFIFLLSVQRLKSSIYSVFQQFAAYFSCITRCLHLYWWKMYCKLLKNRGYRTLFTIVDIYLPFLGPSDWSYHLPSYLSYIQKKIKLTFQKIFCPIVMYFKLGEIEVCHTLLQNSFVNIFSFEKTYLTVATAWCKINFSWWKLNWSNSLSLEGDTFYSQVILHLVLLTFFLL